MQSYIRRWSCGGRCHFDLVLVGDAAVPLDGRVQGFALGEHEDQVVVAAFEELRAELLVVGLLADDADDIDLAVGLVRARRRFRRA